MAIAETAELSVLLKLKDQLGPGLAKDEAKLAQFNATAAKTSTHMATASRGVSGLSRATTGLGGAFGNAKRSLGGLISGPLGIIGLSVGLFGLTGVIGSSINKAEEFGRAISDLSRLTGLDVQTTSRLVDTLDKFGISADAQLRTIGRLEKNVATLADSKKKATAFEKEFGFSLLGTNGKIADANTLLLKSADYFNSNATASQKATVLQKLYGRTWQELIPLLALGSKGIKAEEAAALHLTNAQIQNIAKMRIAQRDFADTVGDLQVLIGTELLPDLTKLLQGLAKGIEDNRGEILGFFRGMLGFAKEIGSAFGTYVIPGIKAIAGAWNAIPADFRKLLLTGFVANKALKVVFGFDPLKIIGGGIADLLKGGLFSRGSPANPMFTKEVGLPGVGGGGPGGGLNPLGILGAIGGGLAIGAAFKILVQDPAFDAATKKIVTDAQRQIASRPGASTLSAALRAVQQGERDIKALPGGEQLYAGQLKAFQQLEKLYRAAIAEVTIKGPAATQKQKEAPRNPRTELTPLQLRHAIQEGNRGLPQRRDLDSTGLRITGAIRQMQGGIRSVEQAGFAAVVTAVWAVQAAVKGLPANFGTPAQQGRGAGPEGRPVVRRDPRTGIEKNRDAPGRRDLNVFHVNVSTSARQNDQGTTIQHRYGPTPATAGAS